MFALFDSRLDHTIHVECGYSGVVLNLLSLDTASTSHANANNYVCYSNKLFTSISRLGEQNKWMISIPNWYVNMNYVCGLDVHGHSSNVYKQTIDYVTRHSRAQQTWYRHYLNITDRN